MVFGSSTEYGDEDKGQEDQRHHRQPDDKESPRWRGYGGVGFPEPTGTSPRSVSATSLAVLTQPKKVVTL